MRRLDALGSIYKVGQIGSDEQIAQNFNALLTTLNAAMLDKHKHKDYTSVFDRYIGK